MTNMRYVNKVFSISPRSTLGTSRDKICLAISPYPLLMSGDQFQDDHHPGRDARSYGREMHHQGLSRLRLRANTTSSFHNIQQCADLRFVKKNLHDQISRPKILHTKSA